MWCAPRVNPGSIVISNVYNIPLYTNNVSTDLFADDTTLYMVGELKIILNKPCRWLYKISLSDVSSMECF